MLMATAKMAMLHLVKKALVKLCQNINLNETELHDTEINIECPDSHIVQSVTPQKKGTEKKNSRNQGNRNLRKEMVGRIFIPTLMS